MSQNQIRKNIPLSAAHCHESAALWRPRDPKAKKIWVRDSAGFNTEELICYSGQLKSWILQKLACKVKNTEFFDTLPMNLYLSPSKWTCLPPSKWTYLPPSKWTFLPPSGWTYLPLSRWTCLPPKELICHPQNELVCNPMYLFATQ